MPRKPAHQVIVDPVAAAAQLGRPAGDPLPDPVPPGMYVDPAQLPSELMEPATEPAQASAGAQCALGHENVQGARFCADCGLPMDAPAPVRADLEAARPTPAGALDAAERAERDRQHLEALAAARQVEAVPVSYVPPEGETVLIHFVEDGLTFAGQVWYRGQEIEIGPSHPRWEQARGWILMDKYQQIERYGKQFFDRGPWPGRRSYLDGAGGYEKLATQDKNGSFAGPGEQALRQADEAERRRGRGVPAPLGGVS